jgi:DNA-binding LacI/PurR family transcriptional regulator
VSVAGFDNVRESSCFLPPLTTIHQDFEAVGRRCVELLLHQVPGSGEAASGTVATIMPRPVERASTAPPPPRR